MFTEPKTNVFEICPQIFLYFLFKKVNSGNSLAVQWLEIHAFTAEGTGSIPGWGTKIPQDTRRSQKKKKKVNSNSPIIRSGLN